MKLCTLLPASALLIAFALLATAQTPAAAPAPAVQPLPRMHSPYGDRLMRMLDQSRAEKRRVVLFVRGEEIAGVVLETGPGFVIVSNQPEQEILLRTLDIERAEFR